MSSNIGVLQKGKLLSGPGAGRASTRPGPPHRASNGSLPVQGQIQSNTGLQPGGVVPNGSLPSPAPGTNPPSPDPSSYLVPGSVSQTPFPAPLATNTATGIMSSQTTLFGYTLPTVVWVGIGLAGAWIVYSMLIEEKKRR